MLNIEIVYGLADKQVLLKEQVEEGTTVRQAVLASSIGQEFDGLQEQLETIPVGSYGKKIMKPELEKVSEGQRIELYRPLIADPKASRLQRANKEK